MISFRYADQVSRGDEMLVQEKGELMPSRVTSVSNIIMQGYCPFQINCDVSFFIPEI